MNTEEKKETKREQIKHYTDSPSYEIDLTSKYCKAMLTQLFNRVCKEINPEEFAMLDTVSCNKNMCQRDLAKLLLKDRANTGRILDSLEKKEYIVRHNDTKNNRLIRRVNITPKGEVLLEQLSQKFEPLRERISKIISDEDLTILRASLKKIRDAIKQIVDMQI